MIRNFKILGLALCAIFSGAAVFATAGLAQQGFLTSDGPVTLKAVETGEGMSFTAFGGKIACPSSVLTGHATGATPHGLIEPPAASATFTPHYSSCVVITGESSMPTTIDMNGCDYEIKSGETGEDEEEYVGTGGVVCPEGKEVQMTVFAGASHAFKTCVISTSNSGVAGSKVTTTEAGGDIDLVGTLVGFVSKKTGLCGVGTDENGTLHVDATVSGYNAAGEQTPISITD